MFGKFVVCVFDFIVCLFFGYGSNFIGVGFVDVFFDGFVVVCQGDVLVWCCIVLMFGLFMRFFEMGVNWVDYGKIMDIVGF